MPFSFSLILITSKFYSYKLSINYSKKRSSCDANSCSANYVISRMFTNPEVKLTYMNKMYQLMHLSLLTLTIIPRHMFRRWKSPSPVGLQRRNICRGMLVNVNKERCIIWYILFIYSKMHGANDIKLN
jgi:hypothetical protein